MIFSPSKHKYIFGPNLLYHIDLLTRAAPATLELVYLAGISLPQAPALKRDLYTALFLRSVPLAEANRNCKSKIRFVHILLEKKKTPLFCVPAFTISFFLSPLAKGN